MWKKKKGRDIKIVTIEKRTNYLVSEPNYHTAKFYIENLLAVEMKKTQIIMNKPVYLGLSILQLVTKYFRLTLVFMWSSLLLEKSNFCFSRVFC